MKNEDGKDRPHDYSLEIGQVLRYTKVEELKATYLDGFRNFKNLVSIKGLPSIQLDRGINTPRKIQDPAGEWRRPAIVITSSPHKKGTKETPWQDFFDVDNGHIRYFGDNKNPGMDPAQSPGNKALLEAFHLAHHHQKEERLKTPPLLFFKRVSRLGKQKGFPQFNGYGVVKNVELVTQWDNKLQRSFTNYAFDFTVFSLEREHEFFDWQWINDRRDPNLALKEADSRAPECWRIWAKKGSNSIESVRRRVSKILIEPAENQKPIPGSDAEKTLDRIYEFFSDKRHQFEALAEIVAARVIGEKYGIYERGWLTPGGADGGADFIGKLTLGSGFSKTKLIVLGQAKCEKPLSPTGGNHIARTVARLRRGWIGAYVTTSYFSLRVQQEVIEDGYPIVLIHGKRVAKEIMDMLHESDEHQNLDQLLESIGDSYQDRLRQRRPEQILR